ncbi:peptide/nickel transport system substrate-binding protein [Malonomonas rubra DSM 5091]|uniref:Peptide/nickel transport system substrate-binding protein n=1 Tax=Malonomonas rubra DSM 5091 TaxID=1122189 RepID=A0A1M6CAL7_MALRU|nr:peptide-binding protein [Malonomonas rubra]SHI57933.1 peptide/nickel transport system substrate-binding protein [Malonomonas rubra DSM 5091]
MKRFCLLRYVLLFAVLLLAGCNNNEQASLPGVEESLTPEYGDTFIEASIGDASVLLPVLASDSASSSINSMLYNGLVRYNKDLVIEGELAESWEISPDNLSIVFKLRKNVKWHDGEPFTSADVKFNYELYVDPKTPTAYAESFRQVTRVEAPDPYTFIAYYDKPYAPALISWGMPIHPKHLLEGQDVTKSPLARNPVGTGPYTLVEWQAGEKIVLESNPDYFEGQPYIKRVVYRIIPDQATQFLELQTGSLDFMGLSPLQYDRQTDTPAFRRLYNKYRYLAFGYTYLGYNLRRPLFQDKRVRQALSFAINKQEIIDGVLLGYGVAATGPYKPDTWVYNPDVPRYDYNPDKARALLAEAGWEDSDGDGILDKDGQKFSFAIVTNQGNDLRSKTGEIIQRRFKEIGVDVKLRIIEWATFLKEFINPGNFDATILGWTGGPEPDSYNVWHSSKTGPQQLNFIGFKNAEVDLALEKGRRVFDLQQRKAFYDKFQEVLAEEQPYTFLYISEALPAVSKRFRGVEAAPAGIRYNFNQWFVPKSEQKYTR